MCQTEESFTDEAAVGCLSAHKLQVRGNDVQKRVEDDAVVLFNANTTIGYARFSRTGKTIDYIFVHPAFRRKGYGRRLIELSERECGSRLIPAPPISPLGQEFFSVLGVRRLLKADLPGSAKCIHD